MWDSFCGDDPPPGVGGLPAPPMPGFPGGQCPVGYNVNYSFKTPTNDVTATKQVLGRIEGLGYVFFFPGDIGYNPANGNIFQLWLYHNGTKVQLSGGNVTNSMLDKAKYTCKINSVQRVDGGLDNCGDTPRFYPPAGIPTPPGGFTSPPTPITFNDNSVSNYYFNFAPPALPPLPAKFVPPVVINYFNASINPEFDIPITFNFDGSINFGDSGGGGNFNQDDRDKLNDIDFNINNIGGVTNNIKNDIDNYINIDNNKPPNPDDFEPPKDDIPPGETKQDYLAAVEVRLTQIPKNAKVQSGNAADNVLYAGWFEWRRAGYNSPREPIHFERSVFIAPAGVDGFAYTLYTGYSGVAKAIINKEKT